MFNELCEVIRLFLPTAEISETEGDELFLHTHTDSDGVWTEELTFRGKTYTHQTAAVYGGLEEKRQLKRTIKTACFLLMKELTGMQPPWGSLTGIRPTRLMYELEAKGICNEDARRELEKTFFVSESKTGLLYDILQMQKGLMDPPEDVFDLYIGIPFCTTRCAYCSFASGELGNGKLVEPYLNALMRELTLSREILGDMKVRAAYMGGGTPTSLNANQMDRLLKHAIRLFPNAREWTVEAGRPDTIDRDKLQVLKDNGVERISVNPQTFSDDTLRRIGRAHTSAQTLEAYELARSMGFHHINMDLISALPGENQDDFAASLNKCISLSPESITVHTLAIKRSSKLHEQGYAQVDADTAAAMVDYARNTLRDADYYPYYLYRQKYMAGNLENVGYAKKGYACLYNIDNMEETTKILATGAGAITKWLFPKELRIERCANVKNIEQYIERVDEMCERKRELIRR